MPIALCPPLYLEGQARVQSPLEVTFPLPEGFDSDEARRLLVRRDYEAEREMVSAPMITISIARSRAYLSVSIRTSSTVTPPSSVL